jgi:AraC-like DNA-binding protein
MSETSSGLSEPASDILSVLLRTVRLRGEEVYCWAPPSSFAVLFEHPGGTLHLVGQGELELQIGDESTVRRYQRGDVFMLPTGQRHTIRYGRKLTPRPLIADDSRLGALGDHGDGTRWLAGTFSFDDSRGAGLLHGLPPLVELRGAGDQSLLWLDVSAQMLMKEKVEPAQGSREMIARILDLLFIQILRAWAITPDATPGWLTGAMDPVVGDAVSAIHADPAHRWTIERLARKSNLSRSAFADRFTRRVGQPPATYITQVRLARAADLLLDTNEPVSAIAGSTGYDSEAAFSRAFTARYGTPPSRWRRASAAAGATSGTSAQPGKS